MKGRPTRKITDWDNEPEKRIADRLAALWLLLEYCHRTGALSDLIYTEVKHVMESSEPKKQKYAWVGALNLWDADGFDGLSLCPKCGGAETRNDGLCLVCQNEARDDNG